MQPPRKINKNRHRDHFLQQWIKHTKDTKRNAHIGYYRREERTIFQKTQKENQKSNSKTQNCKDGTVQEIDGRKILCTATKIYLQSNLYYDQENRILSTFCEINIISTISKKSILLFHPSKNKTKHPRN